MILYSKKHILVFAPNESEDIAMQRFTEPASFYNSNGKLQRHHLKGAARGEMKLEKI